MTDYNGVVRTISRLSEVFLKETTGEDRNLISVVSSTANRISYTGTLALPTSRVIKFINRGKNTGAGAAFAYWVSSDTPDPTGGSYSGSIPFGQLTDIIVVGTFTG
jgi:hypothetical protein